MVLSFALEKETEVDSSAQVELSDISSGTDKETCTLSACSKMLRAS